MGDVALRDSEMRRDWVVVLLGEGDRSMTDAYDHCTCRCDFELLDANTMQPNKL